MVEAKGGRVGTAGIIDFGDYISYWLDKEHTKKNPACDAFSKRVMDLKDQKPSAIKHFQEILAGAAADADAVAVVPSHDPSKTTSGIRKIAQGFATERCQDATSCLVRHTKVDKLAHGGSREVLVHLNSIRVENAERIKGKRVALLDDVATTGNSLLACKKLLEDAGAKKVTCIAVARTLKVTDA